MTKMVSLGVEFGVELGVEFASLFVDDADLKKIINVNAIENISIPGCFQSIRTHSCSWFLGSGWDRSRCGLCGRFRHCHRWRTWISSVFPALFALLTTNSTNYSETDFWEVKNEFSARTRDNVSKCKRSGTILANFTCWYLISPKHQNPEQLRSHQTPFSHHR